MKSEPKSEQLQIRVTRSEKRAIRQGARAANQDISGFVLSHLQLGKRERFENLVAEIGRAGSPSFAFAELNDFLAELSQAEFVSVLKNPPKAPVSDFVGNYICAMVEHTADRRSLPAPDWCRSVRPLEEPFFGTTLISLRGHLLQHAPVAFRRRNLFVDASVGDRV